MISIILTKYKVHKVIVTFVVLYKQVIPFSRPSLLHRVPVLFLAPALSGSRPAAHLSACRLQTKKGRF